jgi:hypothetical protein
MNLKLDKFKEILFVQKLVNMSLSKQNKLTLKGHPSTTPRTYRWMDPTVKVPLLYCGIPLDEATSWVDVCASGASSWSAFNDSWLSLSLLKELAVISCSWRAIDFPLGIYTNLRKQNKQFWYFLKKTFGSTPLI